MAKLIERSTCLANYQVFPLRDFDEINDEESFFYPAVISGNWLSLNISNKAELAPVLAEELEKLFARLCIDQLIFLGDTEQSWISTLALERNEYAPFTAAVNYFRSIGADTTFNGGIAVAKAQYRTFLTHFYTLVRCDASLPYFHFIDDKKQYLGTIHYSGHVRIDSFDEQAVKQLNEQLLKTNFSLVI